MSDTHGDLYFMRYDARHQLVTGGVPFGDPAGHVLDALGTADGGTAVFMDDESHGALLFAQRRPVRPTKPCILTGFFISSTPLFRFLLKLARIALPNARWWVKFDIFEPMTMAWW